MKNFKCNICGSEHKSDLIKEGQWKYVQCDQCGLICLDPVPDKETIKTLYSMDASYLAHRLKGQDRYSRWLNNRTRHFMNIVGDSPNKRSCILDVGCSTGQYLSLARSRGWQIHGIEPCEHTAAFARREFGLEVTNGGAEDVLSVFGPQAFQAITLWDVIEHIQDPKQVLCDLFKSLKPRGKLYLSTPNASGWVAKFHWNTSQKWWGYWPHPEPPYHIYQYNRKTITSLLKDVGFININIVSDEIPLWYTCGYVGEPNICQLFHDPTYIPHGRRLYFISLPVILAARFFKKGDSMIVIAEKD